MSYPFFESTFRNLPIPIVVCSGTAPHSLVFANVNAKLLLNPLFNIEDMISGQEHETRLEDLLRFENPEDLDSLFAALMDAGLLDGFVSTLLTYENRKLTVSLTANRVDFADNTFFVLYLNTTSQESGLSALDTTTVLATAFKMALDTTNAGETIQQILAFVGSSIDVSRTYIFEEISPLYTRNTYEWCNHGVEPAIQDLQNLRKEDYNYDVIVNSGMYITEDVSILPENDRAILEAQGIRALAIIPLMQADKALGYVGYDDCERKRSWNAGELNLLQNVANILASLLVRRDNESATERSIKILQTISDNMDNILYVSDVNTYEVVFANKALADTLGKAPEDIIGKPCWEVLQFKKDGPCEFCPLNEMMDDKHNILQSPYSWEFQNTITGRWYLMRDSIIPWVDGRTVHIESATEITEQKNYEKQLEQSATYDMMTGVYNREWGYKMMQQLYKACAEENRPLSLVFLDVDNLKSVNDTFGHDMGDVLITDIVDIVRSRIRKNDILCRWGGDEFVLMLQCDEESANLIMQDIDAKMAASSKKASRPYHLSVSHGIIPLDAALGAPLDEEITRADQLMYKNKARGRRASAMLPETKLPRLD